MQNDVLAAIIAALQWRGEVRPEGKGWRTRCPSPDHPDVRPSFFVYPGGGGRCFSYCARYWTPQELAELLGVTLPQDKPGLTVAELARAKGLPEEFLRSLGISEGSVGSGKDRTPCVDIPYADERGEVAAVHKRLRLNGHPHFIWRRGDHATLYGLAQLKDIRRADFVILVEGESDVWTLLFNHIPTIGVPGASTWNTQFAPLLDGLLVYVWQEADGGGDALVKAISADIPEARVIEAPPDAKDPSDLYLQDPELFKERMKALVGAALPVSELRAEALGAEERKLFDDAKAALEDPALLHRLGRRALGAGDTSD